MNILPLCVHIWYKKYTGQIDLYQQWINSPNSITKSENKTKIVCIKLACSTLSLYLALLKFNKHLDGLKFIDEGQGVIVFTESSFKII